MTRGVNDLLADLEEAVDAAAELVDQGKERWDAERLLRLAGEAVIGRLGDVATASQARPELPLIVALADALGAELRVVPRPARRRRKEQAASVS